MQLELERLNYPGYWTITEEQDFIGYNGNFAYSFKKSKISKTRYEVVARQVVAQSCVEFFNASERLPSSPAASIESAA